MFQNSGASAGNVVSSAGPSQGSVSHKVGLSWVSVLKGTSASGGLPQGDAPITAVSCSCEVTVPLINCFVPLPHIVDIRASRTIAKISKDDIVDEVKY